MNIDELSDLRTSYKLYPLIFMGGFVSLALQIHAGRLLNTYHGGTTITWGSVLSVFMLTLGLGYFISGKLSSNASMDKLSHVGSACVLLMIIPSIVSTPVVSIGEIAVIDHPLFTSMVIYGLPSLVTGFFSPYAVEIVEEKDGEAAGNVYSVGTVGSVFGALVMTFFFIPVLGVIKSMLVMNFMLFSTLLPLYYFADNRYFLLYIVFIILILVSFVAVSASSENVVYQTQSTYHEIVVTQESGVRYLSLSNSSSSALDLDNPDNYVYGVYDLLHAPVLYYNNTTQINEVLVIGGGAGVLANRYANKYNASVDVVEIDPEVKRVAYEYFDAQNDNVTWHIADGRVYLSQNQDKEYDVIIMNAYNGVTNIPVHLTTREFYQLSKGALDDKGVIATNVIASVNGRNSYFTRSVAQTMDSVYPNTDVYYDDPESEIQNVIIVSTSSRPSKSQIYNRTRDRFSGDLSRDTFTVKRLSELNKEEFEVLRDSTVSEYELLPPEIQRFTYKQNLKSPS